ncbi:hypothetical protein TNCV_4291531 [Trichonephila clavipes]|nr:hypothetical protein TNCV_4291531 [Trichonephila clavipes]
MDVKSIKAQTSSRWCGAEVRRGGGPVQVSFSSFDHGSKLRSPLQIAILQLFSVCDTAYLSGLREPVRRMGCSMASQLCHTVTGFVSSARINSKKKCESH